MCPSTCLPILRVSHTCSKQQRQQQQPKTQGASHRPLPPPYPPFLTFERTSQQLTIARDTEYGECGVGAFCLGGCDPRMSHSLDSCAPAPQCESRTMTLSTTDGSIATEGNYLGDPATADWVQSDGSQVLANKAGGVILTMPKNSAGTVLASTVYMWYGNVKAKMKSSRGAGVVTAFILLSDVKDEIDFEWIGVDLETAQTNYYFQALPDCKFIF